MKYLVLRSWVVHVRLLSAFTVSARETNIFAHYSVQNTIKVKVGIVEQLQNIAPMFGAVMQQGTYSVQEFDFKQPC